MSFHDSGGTVWLGLDRLADLRSFAHGDHITLNWHMNKWQLAWHIRERQKPRDRWTDRVFCFCTCRYVSVSTSHNGMLISSFHTFTVKVYNRTNGCPCLESWQIVWVHVDDCHLSFFSTVLNIYLHLILYYIYLSFYFLAVCFIVYSFFFSILHHVFLSMCLFFWCFLVPLLEFCSFYFCFCYFVWCTSISVLHFFWIFIWLFLFSRFLLFLTIFVLSLVLSWFSSFFLFLSYSFFFMVV